jgi:hypothetical protein
VLSVGTTGFGQNHLFDITVSAAALFLLRTLSDDHTSEEPVTHGNQLFPCCGFNVYPADGRFPAPIDGCPRGFDLDVVHSDGFVTIRDREGAAAVVAEAEWAAAVLGFVASVQAFHDASQRRLVVSERDDDGWGVFLARTGRPCGRAAREWS